MNRRQFITKIAGGLSAAAWNATTAPRARAQATRRPNIIVIMADDLGFSDIGCYGSEIHTPNLDRLAGEGLRGTHAYNVARCCPSRASLLTGLYPHQAGMGGMVSTNTKSRPEGPYQGYLNRQCATIAELLRHAGYQTYMAGKWHVGERPEHWPRKRGFNRYYGLISGASSYWEILPQERAQRTMALDDDPILPEGSQFYMTDAFTDYAVKFLDDHHTTKPQDPFFLYLAYTAPHWPLHAWPEDIAKYQGAYHAGWDELRLRRYKRMLDLGIIEPKWPLAPRDPEVPAWDTVAGKEDWELRMAVYAAMIDRMDQGIGRLLENLRKHGAEDNTLVLFLADNGGCHEDIAGRKLNQPGAKPGERGSFVSYKRPWANLSNTPFRWFKHWVHEGGIATPLIARWPDRIKTPGTLTHQVMHITDIMPTCLDAADAEYPADVDGHALTPLAGKSLLPILDGIIREPHQRLCWEHMNNRAIREGQWKLVATDKGPWELYDMDADRTELNNLAEKHPDKALALYEAWEDWADLCGVEYKKQPPPPTPAPHAAHIPPAQESPQ